MIGCIVQARMGSVRLPGKIFMKLDKENTVLDFVINQINACKLIDKIIIATTNEIQDNKVVEFAKKRELSYFRGSTRDVLDRYYQCAKQFDLDTVVRITSDNPLNDPEVIDRLIQKFIDWDYDYATNELIRTFPQGIFAQVYSIKSLEISWKNAKLPSEREHVSPYIEKNKDKFKIFNLKNNEDLSHLRFTIDRKNDIEFVREIVKRTRDFPVKIKELITICNNEKKILEINKKHILEEGYKKSLLEDQKFLQNNKS